MGIPSFVGIDLYLRHSKLGLHRSVLRRGRGRER